MALITCSDCEKQISNKAKACPNCGCPVPVAARPDVTLTGTQNGYEISLPFLEAFQLSVKAAELVAQSQAQPRVRTLVNSREILIKSEENQTGWFANPDRDALFIEVIPLGEDRTLISIQYEPDLTSVEYVRKIQDNFIYFIQKQLHDKP